MPWLPLSLLQVTDLTLDDSGGEAEITGGGLNHKFVEIRLNSQIGKALLYAITAYAKGTNNTESISHLY